MAYATVTRAIAIYGTDAVTVGTDRDQDGVRDAGVLESFLDLATNEINGYIAGRGLLPLAVVPPHLEKLCIDIAMYQARQTADVMTDEITKRYNAAIRYLERVAEGKIRLVPDDATGAQVAPSSLQAETVQSNEVAVIAGCDRVFSRSSMRGL